MYFLYFYHVCFYSFMCSYHVPSIRLCMTIIYLYHILLYSYHVIYFSYLYSFTYQIYILSYHVFQLTLTKRLVHLVQQFNFQTRCGHQIPLNSILLDSRLNELSIESKNTQNGVLTKELCKLPAMKKSATCSTCNSSSSHWFLSFLDLL